MTDTERDIRLSLIVPVHNRPDEVEELLASLKAQTDNDFELVIVEDGSTVKCEEQVEKYKNDLTINYFYKPNSGPGASRNYGFERAKGNYFIVLDSDCILPPHYVASVRKNLKEHYLDTFGGPDSAHKSFSDVQKAINYAMTSLFTTGGIRGRKKQADVFQPRSFNMGISKEVIETVGGFSRIHPGEDPDLSYRIMDAGFRTGLYADSYVFHKRRIDFGKFIKQVYKFGVVRVILFKWYPSRVKLTYFFPTVFLLGSLLLLLLSFWFPSFLLFLGAYALLLFIDALIQTKHLKIALMAVLASFIQLYAYGWGFLKSFVKLKILGMDEHKAFPDFFFKE